MNLSESEKAEWQGYFECRAKDMGGAVVDTRRSVATSPTNYGCGASSSKVESCISEWLSVRVRSSKGSCHTRHFQPYPFRTVERGQLCEVIA